MDAVTVLFLQRASTPCDSGRTIAFFSFTSAPVIDIFTDKEVKSADNGYSDSEYIWRESEIYYFEKYNLKLNDDFIKYVLNKK